VPLDAPHRARDIGAGFFPGICQADAACGKETAAIFELGDLFQNQV